MSTTVEDIAEQVINAKSKSEYDEAKRAFYDLKKQEGDEILLWQLNNCTLELLRRMHGNLDDHRLQQRCMNILIIFRKFSRHFLGFQFVSLILSFVQERPDDPSVARLGLGLIKDSLDLIDGADLSGVIDIMTLHESDPVVQKYVMIVFFESMEVAYEIQEPRVPRVFLQAMRNHLNNSDVQVAACDALWNSTEACITEEWPPVTILQAMTNHVHCAEVQMAALTLLCRILVGTDDDAVTMTLAGQDYILVILQAMQNHSDHEEVQRTALCVLASIMVIESTTSHIIQGGGVEVVIRASQMIDGSYYYTAIVILEHLCKSRSEARRTAIEGGVISTLLELLRRDELLWPGSLSLATLNHLFLENINNTVSLQITSKGGIETIVHVTIMAVLKICFQLMDDGALAHLAMFPSVDGMLPLHYAAVWGTEKSLREGQIAVVEHLLKVYPEGATIPDGIGRLPLHAAIQANAPLAVLEALLRVNPATEEPVFHRRDDGMLNFPPVLMAAASDCDLESIFVLLRRYDPTPIMKKAAC